MAGGKHLGAPAMVSDTSRILATKSWDCPLTPFTSVPSQLLRDLLEERGPQVSRLARLHPAKQLQ